MKITKHKQSYGLLNVYFLEQGVTRGRCSTGGGLIMGNDSSLVFRVPSILLPQHGVEFLLGSPMPGSPANSRDASRLEPLVATHYDISIQSPSKGTLRNFTMAGLSLQWPTASFAQVPFRSILAVS
jgi:hypothetical protein